MAQNPLALAEDLAEIMAADEGYYADTVQSIPIAHYLDEARAQREIALMRRTPVIAAHASELAPGTAMVFDRLGPSVILARTREGTVHAFRNTCRHRGTRLLKGEGCQKRGTLLCPYHHWSYGLDGRLLAVPEESDGFPGLDKAAMGLRPVPVQERCGFIWVAVEGDAQTDFDAHIDPIAEDLETFGYDTHVFFRRSVSTRACNWKLITDAFLELYHVQRLHKDTIARFFLDNRAISKPKGPHILSAIARLDFKEAFRKAPQDWDLRNEVSFTNYVFPNATTIVHPDYLSLITLYPKSARETEAVHTILIPKNPETEEERIHWEKAWTLIDEGVFQGEDFWVSEEGQAGIDAGGIDEVTLGRFEYALKIFHDTIDKAIEKL